MYSAKPSFDVPDEHTTIWRYMDFTKFVSLLDKKTLYFTRSDKFDDKFEGATPGILYLVVMFFTLYFAKVVVLSMNMNSGLLSLNQAKRVIHHLVCTSLAM